MRTHLRIRGSQASLRPLHPRSSRGDRAPNPVKPVCTSMLCRHELEPFWKPHCVGDQGPRGWTRVLGRKGVWGPLRHVLPLAGAVMALGGVSTREEALVAPAGRSSAPPQGAGGALGTRIKAVRAECHLQEQRRQRGARVLPLQGREAFPPRSGASFPAEDSGGFMRKGAFPPTWAPMWPWVCGVGSQALRREPWNRTPGGQPSDVSSVMYFE